MLIVLFWVPFLPALFLTRNLLRGHGRRGSLWAALVGVGLALCLVAWAGATGWLGTGEAWCGADGCWISSKRQEIEHLVGGILLLWLLGVGVGTALYHARGRGRSLGG